MSSSNSTESSLIESTASPWWHVDFLVVVFWLNLPCYVFCGRQLILSGGRDFFLGLSTGTQYLIGLHALRMVSILSLAVLLGAATSHRHKTRRLFMNIALCTGVLVATVYLVFCFRPAMTALHRLG